MKKLPLTAALASALLACAALAPASAAENPLWANAGGWDVHYQPSTRTCYATASYDGDAMVRFGYSHHARGMYLMVYAPELARLSTENTVPVTIEFDTVGRISGSTSVGLTRSGKYGFIDVATTYGFGYDFAKANWMRLTVNGRSVGRLSLTGTFAASESVLECQKSYNARGEGPTFGQPAAATGSIPLSIRRGTVHATLSVVGTPVTFTVDTGSSDVMVPREIFEKMGLPTTGKSTFVLANGTREELDTFVIPEITANGIRVTNVQASVGQRGSDALLGLTFLHRFDSYTIDRKSSLLLLK